MVLLCAGGPAQTTLDGFVQQQPNQPNQPQQQPQQQRLRQAPGTAQPPPFVDKSGLYTLSPPYVTDLFLCTTEKAQE